MSNEYECILDGSRGRYVPHQFVISGWAEKMNVCPKDQKILKEGPDNPDYWETWDDVVATATFTENGNKYGLEQEGDLFLVLLKD